MQHKHLRTNITIAVTALLIGFFMGRAIIVQNRPVSEVSAEVDGLDIWRYKMRMCESSDNPNAINEYDLDGTPSYGLWQMKPSTYRAWVIKYEPFPYKHFDEADWQNTLMSRWSQERVMDAVIADAENINWEQQFPDCVAMNGEPPSA